MTRYVMHIAVAIAIFIASAGAALAETKVRVAVLKVGGQTNAFVAEQQGFFKKHGLDVELVVVRSGAEGIAAIQGGSLDMVNSIPSFAIISNERGLGLVMVVQNQVAPDNPPESGAVLVPVDSPIKSVTDLADKLIGINALHAQEVISAQHIIRKGGVPRERIKYTEVPYNAMGDAMKRGDVAAVIPVDPFVTSIQQRGLGRVLIWAYHDAVLGECTGAYWTKRTWAEGHVAALEAFRDAIDEANAWLYADEARARAAVSQYTGLPAALVSALPMFTWSTKVNLARWAALVAMLKEEGELTKDQKPEEFIFPLKPPAK